MTQHSRFNSTFSHLSRLFSLDWSIHTSTVPFPSPLANTEYNPPSKCQTCQDADERRLATVMGSVRRFILYNPTGTKAQRAGGYGAHPGTHSCFQRVPCPGIHDRP
ncbi:hypothetical protein RHS01_10852 [Rhizoctonia solani]|uniref:Uncharacterized protein n=1 Tax=Rhizoctonia solani TaxID=456999 RepID=A0A8H7M047_9AGAM|nr:hypothetical protein RHS01_10852 [Rhizoctonia solani]